MIRDKTYDVLVLGAGIAGLAAARALARAGQNVLLLEARERVGGRIWSVQVEGSELPVELGAEFVHGRPRELWELIDEAGLRTFEMDGRQMCFERGLLTECSREDDAFRVLDELSEDEPDLSFAEWIAQKDVSQKTAQDAIAFVQGFNAADAQRIGTRALAKQQKAEDAIEGDRLFRIESGYSTLAEYLLRKFEEAGGRVCLSTLVESVVWREGSVEIVARGTSGSIPPFASGSGWGTRFYARRCVVTLPLGVLQSGSVRFVPEPERVMKAAANLAMGNARRVTYSFRERFWTARATDMSFLFSDVDLPRVWWTPSPHPAPQITGWVGGPKALEAGADEEFALAGLRLLAKMFNLPESRLRELLLGWRTHDWQRDALSSGAYSYAPKDAVAASDVMAEPVEGTLYFAGEHTDTTGHWGTVHGAQRSGLRAARQICLAG